MAKSRKRKKKKNTQTRISPKRYIIENARKLPIVKTYIYPDEWQEGGMANIVVARQHSSGKITAGFFLVDLLLKGVKDSFFMFNVSEREFEEEILKHDFQLTDYDLCHNIIYKSVNFAKQYGFNPCPEFAISRYILEPEDAEIQDIPIQVGGEDGKPTLMESDIVKAENDLLKLNKNAGEGNFNFVLTNDEDDDEYDDEDNDDEDDEYDQDVLGEEGGYFVNVLIFTAIYRKKINDPTFIMPDKRVDNDNLEYDGNKKLSPKEEKLLDRIYDVVTKEEINEEELLDLMRKFFTLNHDKRSYSEIMSILFNEELDDLIEIINEEFVHYYDGNFISRFYSVAIQTTKGNTFPLLSLFKELQSKKEKITSVEELTYFYLTGMLVELKRDNLLDALAYHGAIVDITSNFEMNLYLHRIFDMLNEELAEWIGEYMSSVSKKEQKNIIDEVINIMSNLENE